ncbi:MAG: hypothetical protein HC851_24230 [Acaryochloris sp. RU_4_1]|nr:hypothetical protein [Acaryochloris sp. RU_4_1]
MIKANSPSLQQQDDDDLLPEYDLSKIKFVRGKHAHWHGKPYSVTIHNGDGTATVQRFDGKDNMISEEKMSGLAIAPRIKRLRLSSKVGYV